MRYYDHAAVAASILLPIIQVASPTWKQVNVFAPKFPLEKQYGSFSESERMEMLEKTKEMFYHGYDNYMEHAFPLDELNPLHCCGRGPDYEQPDNININDVLGDYCLTLVDTLDMLAIMGNKSEFQKAVKLVVDTVDFEKSNVVQVFEATIRMLGGLLSGHLLMDDPR